MPFDPSVITEVAPPLRQGSTLTLYWSSTVAPPAYAFQVYVAGALAWYGTQYHAAVPVPSGLIDVQIGAVLASELTTDFSATLTPITTRAQLTWHGAGAAGFHVYQGTAPGNTADLTRPVANVVAVEQGLPSDGYDLGGYDAGGYDSTGGDYIWTSASLWYGPWQFTVVPYDDAGNEGTPTSITVMISCPPRPPAIDSSGRRLEYVYNPATFAATLSWLASPG